MAAETFNITTKEKVQAYLGITGDNDLLDTLCNSITAWIEGLCGGRRFKLTTYANKLFDGDNFGEWLQLPHWPVTEWTKIEYNSGTSKTPSWTTFDRDDYETYDDEGALYFNKKYLGKRNIRISYKAGYTTIPYDMEFLATRLVARSYERRKSEGVMNESLGGMSINWKEFLEKEDISILDNYRRPMVI